MLIKLKKKFRIYIYLKSFSLKYILRDIKALFFYLIRAKLIFLDKKLIYLPCRIKKFSVVKSPFVSKLSKEQLELRIYKIILILKMDNNLLIEFFRSINWLKASLKHSYYKLVVYYIIEKNRSK